MMMYLLRALSNRSADHKAANIFSGTKEGTSQSPRNESAVAKAEEVKMLLRLFPIWLTSIVYSVAYAQIGTTFIQQGKAMHTKIRSFSIPPASLVAFEILCVILLVLLYDTLVAMMVRKLSLLQRMGIGHFLMILAMAVAAIVEAKRLQSVNSGKPLSILWQLLQYFVVAASEVFFYIGQLEFFYDQGPDSMKSLPTSVSLLTISLGSYLSSLVLTLVSLVTARGGGAGWISHDLNEGHLDYFFWLLWTLCLLNFVCYIACAWKYAVENFIW